jgi:hypothetical protein
VYAVRYGSGAGPVVRPTDSDQPLSERDDDDDDAAAALLLAGLALVARLVAGCAALTAGTALSVENTAVGADVVRGTLATPLESTGAACE